MIGHRSKKSSIPISPTAGAEMTLQFCTFQSKSFIGLEVRMDGLFLLWFSGKFPVDAQFHKSRTLNQNFRFGQLPMSYFSDKMFITPLINSKSYLHHFRQFYSSLALFTGIRVAFLLQVMLLLFCLHKIAIKFLPRIRDGEHGKSTHA